MKLVDLVFEETIEDNMVTPKITWRTNGDKSYTVRIDYGNDRVYVHTNKNRSALEAIVKDRYGPRHFSK